MRALFSATGSMPLSRVARDYRLWILLVGAGLAINLAVLAFVVWPLSATADASARRATTAADTRRDAQAELTSAEGLRDGSAQAARDLERFYGEVLPPDLASARRLAHLKLSQMAREHNVTFQRSASTPEIIRGSSLERLSVSYALAGEYADVRALIYEMETAPDFLVIDDVFLSEGSEEQAPLTLTLNFSTFYLAARRAP